MQLTAIRALIFDLGGVVINIDPPRAVAALQQLAAPLVSVTDVFLEHHAVFLDYEKGLIDDHAFREGIRDLTRRPDLSDAAIDEAWCSMLFEIPAERLQLLKRLKAQYRTFVLSNTNQIHVDAFNRIVASVSGQSSLDPYFEKVYFSHDLKMRKPEAQIYQHVLREQGLTPSETLFLDDREDNLAAARAEGIRTQLVTPASGILELFAA
jgi:putative hydrolase of the HAD superfamily